LYMDHSKWFETRGWIDLGRKAKIIASYNGYLLC
jgi:hypothetical protein